MVGLSKSLLFKGPRTTTNFRVLVNLVVAAALITSMFGLWRVGNDATREIERLAIANAESSQWALAQSEVEALKLLVTLNDARNDQSSIDTAVIRRQFDIFYARISILSSGSVFQSMRDRPEVANAIRTVSDGLDGILPIIDGPDDQLARSVALLHDEVRDFSAALRFISLEGIQEYSQLALDRRQRVSAVMFELALIASSLIGLVLVILAALLLQLVQIRRSTAELSAAEDRLRAVVETALDAVVVTDRHGVILDYNGAAEQIFGYTKSEAIGRRMRALFLAPQGQSSGAKFSKKSVNWFSNSGIRQVQARRKLGDIFPAEVATSSAVSTQGEIFVSFVRDISDRVASEEALRTARDDALAGEKAKADLLAVMSHEMRTPINGIVGSLEVLSDSNLNSEQRRFISAMQSSSRMLLRHVNSVLDISRIDAGDDVALKDDFLPAETIANVVRSLQGQAVARGNDLNFKVLTDDVGACTGDPERIEQVMLNLIGNAIKFTENGSVFVEMERLPGSDIVEIRVIDTGLGIASDDLDRVFEDFVTLDASYDRAVEGTGLGLAIVRRLCTIMGGEVGVESEEGEGSLFWVRLPLPQSKSRQFADHALDGGVSEILCDVLLVEDNQINRLVAFEMLKTLGCNVIEAVSGRAGVDWTKAKAFDVIFMDISMPGLSGLEAAAEIRANAGLNSQTPIVAMTAHTLPEDIAHFREAGMADVIVKPISKARLRQVLIEQIPRLSEVDVGEDAQAETLADTRKELVAMIGEDAATQLTRRARMEIKRGLEKLNTEKTSDRECTNAEHLHQLVGIAAVVGLSDLRATLLKAQSAARDADVALMQSHIAKAQSILSQSEESTQTPVE
ncbi:hybrid sensor histidine kinase/response regulator [Yoonia litorea]|uniref:histidine kinase n=1 Tax=Yoonia litorea TaxID=1123755 RepID=A0A1I6M705_9RHOB|nr:ATP-binding protein [Yoonia litorea]SFS11403.1 PAS/PAC sensor hybrid histidine kinase [Yoonia litorea]